MVTATKKQKKAETAPKYAWRDGSRFPVSADIAGRELDRIARESGSAIGHLTPAEVVTQSRPEKAPLHACFEWDIDKAAALYNCVQARGLINSVRVVFENPDGGTDLQAVNYIRVHIADVGSCYVSSALVMSDETLRQEAIAEAVTLLRGVQKRFEHLSELRDVFEAINRL